MESYGENNSLRRTQAGTGMNCPHLKLELRPVRFTWTATCNIKG